MKPKKNCLTPEQFEELLSSWTELCENNFKQFGDRGSCVLGAGLRVGGTELINQRSVARAQGSLNWEVGLDTMLNKFNKKHGTEVYYYPGWLD